MHVTTPGVTRPALNFDPPVGTAFNVLHDPDGNFSMDVTLHEVNADHNKGIQQADFTANGHAVQFANDGSLIVDGVNKGNINTAGLLASIDLGNGVSVKTALMNDGGGVQAERFVLVTPEYEITAARRTPDQTLAYYDINIAELTATASDNATGSDIPNQGGIGIDDLLRQES